MSETVNCIPERRILSIKRKRDGELKCRNKLFPQKAEPKR